jgi:hypothetical protein
MVRRRSFLISCSSLAAVPAVPAFGGTAPLAAVPSAATLPTAAAMPSEAEPLELRIAGWDPQAAPGAADTGVWVQVSSSWQVAWR